MNPLFILYRDKKRSLSDSEPFGWDVIAVVSINTWRTRTVTDDDGSTHQIHDQEWTTLCRSDKTRVLMQFQGVDLEELESMIADDVYTIR